LVFGAQSLLTLTTELKHSILVNDFETMNENVASQSKQFARETRATEDQLELFNQDILQSLSELEDELTRSSRSFTAPTATAATLATTPGVGSDGSLLDNLVLRSNSNAAAT